MLALASSIAEAKSMTVLEPITPPPLPAGARTSPVSLSKVLVDLASDQEWGELRGGYLCIPNRKLKWKPGLIELPPRRLLEVFEGNIRAGGFTGDDTLFDGSDNNESGEFSVGARIKSIEAEICSWGYQGNDFEVTSANMDVEWSIYSRLQRKVISTVRTSGGYKKAASAKEALIGAFGRSTLALTATGEFRMAFVLPTNEQANGPFPAQDSQTINLIGIKSNGPRAISEVSGSVVAVFSGASLGSGFLVSSEGYLITNAHVVGANRKVRIKWSDGFESDGEVVRSNTARDVALIRTNPHDRRPLDLRRGAVTEGATVFAIGTPLDEKLQNTLTKGIVSANRIVNGFSYIQSDVAVTHGNSGGPLLDSQGSVIGVTVLGYRPDGVSENLNFFIPIGDALDFLNLKPAA
jgi:serine protease Do